MSRRDGFTLVEMLVALGIFGALLALTLGMMNDQVRAFYSGADQMDAAQNLRFAMDILEKDLPTAGSGVPTGQPHIVYADTHVVVFNADFATADPNDMFAVYVDSGASPLSIMSLPHSRRITLPNSTTQYPDTTYRAGISNSPAETIMFYVQPDSSGGVSNAFSMWRQVNDQAPELVARNLLRSASGPFFRYYQRITPNPGVPYLDSIATGQLPLRHGVVIHGAPSDTLPFALIDRVRAVEVRFRATDGRRPSDRRVFETRRTIALPNAGLQERRTCGDEPLLGGMTFTAIADTTGGVARVHLAWNQAIDESAGELDVVRYVVWRSTITPSHVDAPHLSVPAGVSDYAHVDIGMASGQTYYYAIAAQDCTPQLSSLRVVSVTVPLIP